MGTPPVYNQATRPVSVSEFKDVISAICPPRWRMARATRSRPVALAVSGGLDSMALAYLFYSTAKTYGSTFAVADNPVASVYGLVIDHDLREGSAQEARTVCGWLTNIGIRGRSYTLGAKANKGQPVDLREQTNFETTARYLRYRTLGLAASELGATSVFSAHHKDDQYETLLMRLIAGHKYRGLQGIRAANPIPECHDLHGIYNSGLLDDQQHNYPFLSFKPSNRTIRRIRTMFQEDRTEETLEQADSLRPKLADWLPGHFDRDIDPHVPYLSPIPCEDGGIVIYRPLLDFDKDRLRATCEAYKVPWVEDHTNADPTITVRNAVRHMVRYNTLPKALQKPAILGLGERAKRRVEFEEAEARRLLIREAVIKDFDTNVGTILVELPTFRWSVRRLYREAREEAWRPHRRRIAGLVIRKLMDFVTPDKHLPTLSNLDTAINAMFPELRSGPRSIQPKAFSMGSILFEPIVGRGTTKWLMSRAPYSSREARPYLRSQDPRRKRCGPQGTTLEPTHGHSLWRMWRAPQLYDGRYWIRVSFRVTSAPCTVRPYEPELGKAFRRELGPRQRARLERLLKYYAPGKVRTTIPAIYSAGTATEGEPGKPILLALPTLRIHIPGTERHLSYEVRYRKVDVSLLGHRKKGDGLQTLRQPWTPSPSLARRRRRARARRLGQKSRASQHKTS